MYVLKLKRNRNKQLQMGFYVLETQVTCET